MNIKFKKSMAAAILILTFPATHVVHASGIPTVDAVQLAHSIWEQGVAWTERVRNWKANLDNWKANLENMIRSKISDFLGIQLSGKMSEEELTRIWEKGRVRCNQISNATSKSYCNQMITLEIEKIKLYFQGEASIDAQWQQFMRLRDYYNSEQSSGTNNASHLQTIADNMEKVLGKIEIDMKTYEQRIALIDTRIQWLREARVKIAQEQLQGTNRTVIDNISKAAVIITLETSRQNSKSKAKELRKANRSRSAAAFGSRM